MLPGGQLMLQVYSCCNDHIYKIVSSSQASKHFLRISYIQYGTLMAFHTCIKQYFIAAFTPSNILLSFFTETGKENIMAPKLNSLLLAKNLDQKT